MGAGKLISGEAGQFDLVARMAAGLADAIPARTGPACVRVAVAAATLAQSLNRRAPEISADANCTSPHGPCSSASCARSLPALVKTSRPCREPFGYGDVEVAAKRSISRVTLIYSQRPCRWPLMVSVKVPEGSFVPTELSYGCVQISGVQ